MAITTISLYIDSLDENGKQFVEAFIRYMNNEFPQLTLKISFSMPLWLVDKKMKDGYVAISTAKKHISIHFSDEDFVMQLGKLLSQCKTGK